MGLVQNPVPVRSPAGSHLIISHRFSVQERMIQSQRRGNHVRVPDRFFHPECSSDIRPFGDLFVSGRFHSDETAFPLTGRLQRGYKFCGTAPGAFLPLVIPGLHSDLIAGKRLHGKLFRLYLSGLIRLPLFAVVHRPGKIPVLRDLQPVSALGDILPVRFHGPGELGTVQNSHRIFQIING